MTDAGATFRGRQISGGACLVLSLLLLAFGLPARASAAGARAVLCKPISPSLVPLPSWLTVEMEDYTYQLSPNARVHHGLCSVAISSPTDDYRYNVEWDVFPTHGDAVADLSAVPLSTIYELPSVRQPVPGLPAPSFELTGTAANSRRQVADVTLVDGKAIVSAYIYGGSASLPQAVKLATWAVRDVNALDAKG